MILTSGSKERLNYLPSLSKPLNPIPKLEELNRRYFKLYQEVTLPEIKLLTGDDAQKVIEHMRNWLKGRPETGSAILEELTESSIQWEVYRVDLKEGKPKTTIFFLSQNHEKLLDTICKRIMVLKKIVNSTLPFAKVYCYPSAKTRVMDRKQFQNDPIIEIKQMVERSEAHTVSGETNFAKSQIILTKAEELAKLTFHELIHFFGLDKVGKKFRDALPGTYENWNVDPQTPLSIMEAYTEMCCNIYHCMAICAEINDPEKFRDLLEQERIYSLYVTAKLLHYFKYDQVSDFFTGTGVPLFSPIPIVDYNICRSLLFYHLDQLEPYLDKNTLGIVDGYLEKEAELLKPSQEYLEELQQMLERVKKNDDLGLTYTVLDLDYQRMGHTGGSIDYYQKFLKYKMKYLQLKQQMN